MTDSHQPSISAISLPQSHNSLPMHGTNHRIDFPVSNSPANFNISWTLANRAYIDNLTSPLNPTGVSLFALPLTSEILPKSPSSSFIRINMLIKRFMDSWQFSSNLLGAKLLSNATGIKTTYAPLLSKSIGLLRSVPGAPFVFNNISKNGGLAVAKILGNFGAIEFFFHETKNLISFSLTEVFTGHGNLTVQIKKL